MKPPKTRKPSTGKRKPKPATLPKPFWNEPAPKPEPKK
jgi:hypothetical protein